MPMGSQDFWYNPTWGPENGSILISLVPTSASPGQKCCKSKIHSPACMPSMQGRRGCDGGGGRKATVAECETLGSVCPGLPPARAQRRDPRTARPFRLGHHPTPYHSVVTAALPPQPWQDSVLGEGRGDSASKEGRGDIRGDGRGDR
jgi:hypothetical protein